MNFKNIIRYRDKLKIIGLLAQILKLTNTVTIKPQNYFCVQEERLWLYA